MAADRSCAGRSAHLGHKSREHRVDGGSAHRFDRCLPQFPSVDEVATQQRLDHLELEASMYFERSKLLEIVEFTIENLGFDCVVGDESHHRIPQRLFRFELSDEAASFHSGSSSQRLKNSTAIWACLPIRASRVWTPA
jgi:hypothetical protein